MDHLQALRLPSMANFNAGFMLTKAVQLAGCALSSNGSGGTVHYKVHFVKNGGAWILFIFLDTYTRMFWTVTTTNSLGRGSLDPDEFYMGNSYNLHNCIFKVYFILIVIKIYLEECHGSDHFASLGEGNKK
ncbi:unnamed protein product [Brassica oleracea var. botrytis]|uniref:Uncharacterized protein n=2 Tax=Brassica TaxID=3705 RepID=A0A3P6CMF4_BRAOL|nr:unnamed protein product [Brassica napus]VDD15730.1 unnamed protein product [Brassica oleracea]